VSRSASVRSSAAIADRGHDGHAVEIDRVRELTATGTSARSICARIQSKPAPADGAYGLSPPLASDGAGSRARPSTVSACDVPSSPATPSGLTKNSAPDTPRSRAHAPPEVGLSSARIAPSRSGRASLEETAQDTFPLRAYPATSTPSGDRAPTTGLPRSFPSQIEPSADNRSRARASNRLGSERSTQVIFPSARQDSVAEPAAATPASASDSPRVKSRSSSGWNSENQVDGRSVTARSPARVMNARSPPSRSIRGT
jgi:hypothetical protein